MSQMKSLGHSWTLRSIAIRHSNGANLHVRAMQSAFVLSQLTLSRLKAKTANTGDLGSMSFIVGDEAYAFRTCKMLHNVANDFALRSISTENTYGGLKTSYVFSVSSSTIAYTAGSHQPL